MPTRASVPGALGTKNIDSNNVMPHAWYIGYTNPLYRSLATLDMNDADVNLLSPTFGRIHRKVLCRDVMKTQEGITETRLIEIKKKTKDMIYNFFYHFELADKIIITKTANGVVKDIELYCEPNKKILGRMAVSYLWRLLQDKQKKYFSYETADDVKKILSYHTTKENNRMQYSNVPIEVKVGAVPVKRYTT